MAGLSAPDRERVEAAVAAAEARTGAEFAVVVAAASDDYAAYPLLWAAILALIAGGAAALARPDLDSGPVFALEAGIFVAAGLLLHLRPLRFVLVPPAVKRAHASRLARLQFAALVQDRTGRDVGVLLFLSLAERHVEILTDRVIDRRIPADAWRDVVGRFVAAVRAGRVAAALVAAVEDCTVLLETHFPPLPGGRNEIPDRVTEI